MECLRIKLHQTSANYRKEETVDNKMTYPLPPFSTIIGALHKACGYTSYQNMDISVQGKYESMHREPYTDYCFLNSTMDDRGILVKLPGDNIISTAYTRVASAKKSQGNSFRKGITIKVENEGLLKEYRDLKDLGDKIKTMKDEAKSKINSLKSERAEVSKAKKNVEKDSNEFKELTQREKELKQAENNINNQIKTFEEENYTKPISKFRTLTTSLKYYEILDEVDLIIHIQADEKTLTDIENNIYNLKALGRSEDFVYVEECKRVELSTELNEGYLYSENSAYLDIEAVRDGEISSRGTESQRNFVGTKYYINKEYSFEKNKRIFKKENKKKVIYISQYSIEECSKDYKIYTDGKYIVNLI